jgi:hypothetical protein
VLHRGGYFGRVNLVTREKENFKLDHLFDFDTPYALFSSLICFFFLSFCCSSGFYLYTVGHIYRFLDNYFALAEQVLVLSEDDLKDPNKLPSHTGAVIPSPPSHTYSLRSVDADDLSRPQRQLWPAENVRPLGTSTT